MLAVFLSPLSCSFLFLLFFFSFSYFLFYPFPLLFSLPSSWKKTGQAANAIETTEYRIHHRHLPVSVYAWRLCGSYDDNLVRSAPSSWPSLNAVTPHPHASGVSQQQPGLVRCCSAPLLVRRVFRFRRVGRGHCNGRAGTSSRAVRKTFRPPRQGSAVVERDSSVRRPWVYANVDMSFALKPPARSACRLSCVVWLPD